MNNQEFLIEAEEVEKKLDAAHKEVVELCRGNKNWVMSIPARPQHDSDLVIGDALRSANRLLNKIREQKEERLNLLKDSEHIRLEFRRFRGITNLCLSYKGKEDVVNMVDQGILDRDLDNAELWDFIWDGMKRKMQEHLKERKALQDGKHND